MTKLTFLVLSIFILQALCQSERETYKCLDLANSLCLQNGNYTIGLDNKPLSLVGWWNFDDIYSSDQSGYDNNIFPPPVAGPQYGGNGYSAKFNYSNYSVINHIQAYETNEFTLSFWIYLLQDPVGVWRTIIHKGSTLTELTPTVQLWPDSNRIHARVTTDANWNEGVDSNAFLLYGRWTHVAVVVSNQLIQLYVNGQLDTQSVLEAPVLINTGPWYVGGDPWHPGVGMFMDDLRYYKNAQKQQDFIAIAQQLVPFYGNNFYAVLGSPSCNYYEAVNSCPTGYQLCSMSELYVGGYWTARIMGWFNNNQDVWVRVNFDQLSKEDTKAYLDPNVYKMGICCLMQNNV